MQIATPTSRSARDRGLGDSFVLRKLVGWANHAHLHVLRKEATTPDMPHPQPRGLQEATGSVWITIGSGTRRMSSWKSVHTRRSNTGSGPYVPSSVTFSRPIKSSALLCLTL